MSQTAKLLERMRTNPKSDWRIEDVQSVCTAFGVSCRNPNVGSHYVVSHPSQTEILTVPFKRPIKPVSIRRLVTYILAVQAGSGDD